MGSVVAALTPIVATISCTRWTQSHILPPPEEGGYTPEYGNGGSGEAGNPSQNELVLKPGARLYGNEVKYENGHFEVTNSVERKGQEPENDKLLALFDFVGKGKVELDESWGTTFGEQMEDYGYASYIVTDKLSNDREDKRQLIFYKAK